MGRIRSKIICQACHGNGYIKNPPSFDKSLEIIIQCVRCDSQGELTLEQQKRNLFINPVTA
tara:strand:- start:319 stop:501 length:183 start_codon:yes stop_codon:yes gene_type:complete